jgi:glucose/arabinose dehydrogenase
MERRRFLALGAAVGTGGLAGCAFRESTESQIGEGPEIVLEPLVEGVTFPVELSFLPNGERLVVERFGVIMRHTDEGLAKRPFLDLREQMAEVEQEKGLLGLALHPNFAENRKLYVRYSAPLREGMPEGYSHTGVLSEFRATSDLTGVEPDSERLLLELPEPGGQHNAGDLSFGPDGYLYASLGDGQRTNLEREVEDSSWWYDQGQAAQNTEDNLLGGILRIDVDATEGDRPYGIPSDNPLVGEAGRDEYFAWGLRNPYRISFDDGDLYVGDVGEHIRESVYIVENGDNCGWPILEGSSCSASTSIGHAVSENPAKAFNPKTWLAQTNRISPIKVCPPSSKSSGRFADPIAEYQRSGSRSVTGGVVYRGDDVPELQGQYIFGDFIIPAPIFALDSPGEGERPQPFAELQVSHTDSGRLQSGLLGFARDDDGEVYVLTTGFNEGSGMVRRITTPE